MADYDLGGFQQGSPSFYDLLLQRLGVSSPPTSQQGFSPDVGGTSPQAAPPPGGDPWTGGRMSSNPQMQLAANNDDPAKSYPQAFTPYQKGVPGPYQQAPITPAPQVPTLWQKLKGLFSDDGSNRPTQLAYDDTRTNGSMNYNGLPLSPAQGGPMPDMNEVRRILLEQQLRSGNNYFNKALGG